MKVALLLGLLLVIAAPALAQPGNNSTTNGTTANGTTNTTAGSNETAAPAGPVEIALEGHQDGGSFYWTLAGATEHNPTLHVEPGQKVTFHVKSVAGFHDLKVGDVKLIKSFDDTSGTIDVEWTAPATPGTVVYICTIHGSGMSGRIVVGAAESGGASGGEGGAITGESVDLADLKDEKTGAPLYPQCAGKGVKIPAIVAKHVTGGPAPDDYAKRCSQVVAADPYKNVDLVIPISFALIGLGVVATVWVHRSYKP